MKAPSSRLAETTPELLRRRDATMIPVVIKYDYDGLASYQGTVNGLEATSPSVTGQPLGNGPREQAYNAYVANRERSISAEIRRRVRQTTFGQSLRIVYGGVAARVPANRVPQILAVPGVVAVQEDALRQLTTDASPEFIGATELYPQLGGTSNAGAGLIFGGLDSGAWPEHASFADQGNLSAPPLTRDGLPRQCDFGDNPLTPAVDPFVCNNKLIGGDAFMDTYNAAVGDDIFVNQSRDSNGHGTHTASTAAGNAVASAPILGVERGPINGIAPGAHVMIYKVCGPQGCFSSDSAAAVGRAILDGVNVINFSISGGTSPFSDPVELAFLDAYAARVFVATSGGNDGPGAGTVNHLSPWVTTVAASTQTREFFSTLTVTAGADTFTMDGASIMPGAGPLPIVLASDPPYSNALCLNPAAPGTFTGKIVACQRGTNARVDKGFNVLQGGAAGMVLYNATLADVETDTHWLPAVHLADGTAFLAFMNGHSGETASFPAGQKRDGQGDVMAAFSSRGPAGLFIKPDVTAPGVQILAGDTPISESITEGPPGEFFQAIAGTSMSSPHTAGSALLLRALHPTWDPGQIKSALMTTATQNVVKEDLSTPADPFDFGSGRIQLGPASTPDLVFSETPGRFAALANDAVRAIDLNLPSINAPVMPGRLSTERTATNVSGTYQTFTLETTSPAGATITADPASLTLGPGESGTVTIGIVSTAPTAQFFGEVRLVGDDSTLHLPVAFVTKQGDVSLTSSCTPQSIAVNATSTCDVVATNNAAGDAAVNVRSRTNGPLAVTGATGATVVDPRTVQLAPTVLSGAQPGVPAVDPGALFGYIPLDAFGITPIPIGDEEIINFNVPAYVYAGVTYTQIGVDSNGYVLAGFGDSEDNECCNLPGGPDPAPPNNMLAPFWTDLDGTGAPGILAATLTDGVNTWLVVEWRVNVFGTADTRTFQTWIGVDGFEDITYAYAAPQANPNGQPFLYGAENVDGEGEMLASLPTVDQRVTSTDPVPGDSVSYSFTVKGTRAGPGRVNTTMTSPQVPGQTLVSTPITVTP